MTQRATLRVVVYPNIYVEPSLCREIYFAAQASEVHREADAVHRHPILDSLDIIFCFTASRNANAAMAQRIG